MPFSVILQPSQRRLTVPEGQTLLDAALREGVGLPYGCRDGACGACRCRLLEGRVAHGPHQDKALSAADEAAGWMLSCCATPLSDAVVEVRTVAGAGEHPVLKMPARVLSIAHPVPDVAVLRLQLPANQNFRYHAGQYVQVVLRDGARRAYSMANAPQQLGEPPAIELHIRHLPGGKFTDWVFSGLKPRDILRLEGPFGSFLLREGEAPMVLLASGTGIAPIRALLDDMHARGIVRPTTLYWGCRQGADLYLDDDLRAAAAARPWLRYVPVLSEPPPGDGWTGRTGLVHQAVMADWPDLSAHEVYACGAPLMVDAAQRDFIQHCGLPGDAFFADAFVSEADKQAV